MRMRLQPSVRPMQKRSRHRFMVKAWTDCSVHVRNDLRGIVNGIDYDEFNPETDTYITEPL